MLVRLYFKEKKSRIYTYENTITFPILITTLNELFIYTYIKYIKSSRISLSQANLTHIEAYGIFKKQNKCLNLLSTSYPRLYVKDNLSHKIILIKDNFKDTQYLFTNNILLPRNIISQVTHRQVNGTPTVFFLHNKIHNNPSLLFYSFYKDYIYITQYYKYWKTLFLNNEYIYSFCSGIIKKQKQPFTLSTKDITSGLISIETIFESRAIPNTYLIPTKLGILTNVTLSYEESTLSYLWRYNLYTFSKKNLLFFTDITKDFVHLYEQKTSLLLPNNIITSGNYSINLLLLKLFAHNLSYYPQDKAITLSHIFIFNVIVESLIKQYFKNGIVIPSIQFELLGNKMTSFVRINYIGDSSLIENDIFSFSALKTLNYTLCILGYRQLLYSPIVLGISKSILAASGFLASISFQEIIRYLIKLSMEHSTEWLTDLKSKIITTDLIKTGSGWHRHFIKI